MTVVITKLIDLVHITSLSTHRASRPTVNVARKGRSSRRASVDLRL